MDELASDTVRAVAVLAELLAQLGLVQVRDICLDHHVRVAVGKGALNVVLVCEVITYLVTEFASAVHPPVLAHFSPELLHVGSRRSELVVQG